MRFQFPQFAAIAAALVFAVSAHAVEYNQVNAAASQISFTFSQFGSRVYGTFSQFEGTLDFDTQNPAAAHAALSIQLASIDAGSSDANTELQKPAWFDTEHYPLGLFKSTSVKALGGDRYLFTGDLTLKTVTHPVQVQVELKAESGIGVFVGEFALNRDDFQIGAGEWADGVVSKDINIRFRMVAPQR
ncbi:YceI family protein [Pseudomonas frederiksbergensis]|uniref:Polyisoprenoid-binding protein n=1 Tax=Pseudomonas frederiksbergensis TaxID=104087 RepID=A0A423KCT9_9PSED|nr:YceI family protein [Pseudomonas frederiksbergensis]RON50152.1 polyisoprenoid-binding protein [Pseudomonas frederiksbergensis]